MHLLSGSVMELAEVEKDKPSNRFNDGKCDSSGRLWCGTLERLQKFEGSKPAMPTPNVGALYSYSAGEGFVWFIEHMHSSF